MAKKESQKEQSKRFVEKAIELGIPNDGNDFERAFEKIIVPNSLPLSQRTEEPQQRGQNKRGLLE